MDKNNHLLAPISVLVGMVLIAVAIIVTGNAVPNVNVNVERGGQPVVVSGDSGATPMTQFGVTNTSTASNFGSIILSEDLDVGDELRVTGSATFLSTVTQNSDFTLGSNGTAIDFIGYASSTIDVDNLTASSNTSTDITVTGATVGDSVEVALPAAWTGNATTSINVYGNVSVADTVTLHFVNGSSTAAHNLTSADYGVTVTSPGSN